jgi:hypothetical protein
MSGRELTDADLERVARDLAVITQTSQWDRILAIGKLIFISFFGGDEQAWHERRNKDCSIRNLARRPDCPFGKSALTDAIGIYVLTSRHPELRRLERITPTHVGKALSLKPMMAVALLQTADQAGWTVRELAQESKRMRRAMGERRGRPVSRSDRRAERSGRRALRALERMRIELSSVTSVDSIAHQRLTSVCRALQQEVTAMQQMLDQGSPLPAGARAAPKSSLPPSFRGAPERDPLSAMG